MADSRLSAKNAGTRPRFASLAGLSAMLPGIGAALLPAVTCPACWPAYAGLLSSFGLGFMDYSPWLMPMIVVFLAIALAALAWQSHQRRAYGPLVAGIIGAALLVLGKFQLESEITLYAGVVLLVGASVWNAWPRKAPTACALPTGMTGSPGRE